MLTRLMMVAAVAALGVDWRCDGCQAPEAPDESGFATIGSLWELWAPTSTECLAPAASPAVAEPAPATATSESAELDAAFAQVVSDVVGTFVAERAPEPTPLETTVAGLPESFEVPTDLYPGLAFELNRLSEGLATSPEATVPAPETMVAEVEPSTSTSADSGRADRFHAALRLTGQAVHAWLSLLQAPTVASRDEPAALSR